MERRTFTRKWPCHCCLRGQHFPFTHEGRLSSLAASVQSLSKILYYGPSSNIFFLARPGGWCCLFPISEGCATVWCTSPVCPYFRKRLGVFGGDHESAPPTFAQNYTGSHSHSHQFGPSKNFPCQWDEIALFTNAHLKHKVAAPRSTPVPWIGKEVFISGQHFMKGQKAIIMDVLANHPTSSGLRIEIQSSTLYVVAPFRRMTINYDDVVDARYLCFWTG